VNGADPLAALADIELPAPPDWRPLIGLAAAVLLFAAWALILHIRARRRGRTSSPTLSPAPSPGTGEGVKLTREAQQRLERLRSEWASGAVEPRAAAYRLAALLRLGLGLPQLLPAAPPAGLDPGEWRDTLLLLRALRYAPASAQTLREETFARAQRWLDGPHAAEAARDV
jgi:hypothetical protein